MDKTEIKETFKDLSARAGVKTGLTFGRVDFAESGFARPWQFLTGPYTVCVNDQAIRDLGLDAPQIQGPLAHELTHIERFTKNANAIWIQPPRFYESGMNAERLAYGLIEDGLYGDALADELNRLATPARAATSKRDYDLTKALWTYAEEFAADGGAARLCRHDGLASFLRNPRISREYTRHHPSVHLRTKAIEKQLENI